MFEELLTTAYYGNTVASWLYALLIIVIFFVIGKIIYWISGTFLKKITDKTKTKIDDIIVDMVEEPVVFAITLIGIWIALKTLAFSIKVSNWINHLFQFLILFNVVWLITRLLDSLFKEYLVPLVSKIETDLDDQLLPIVRRGSKFVIWTLAIIVGLNNAGYNVGAMIAGLGIGGLAFALAAQDTISNMFGGFTIFIDRPFKLKDRIKIIGIDGTVKEIGLRITRLETLEGRLITIPNSTFSKNPIENVSSEEGRKIILELCLTYDTTLQKMEKAIEILKEISINSSDVIKENTKVYFKTYADSSLNIEYIYWIKKSSDIAKTQSDVNLEILKHFNKNKIEFAFPTRTLYMKKG